MKKYRLKGILCLAAALIMLCAIKGSAQETAAVCPSCGIGIAEITYTDWNRDTVFADNTVTGDCHYRLTEDVTLSECVEVGAEANLVLDLNGFSLRAAEENRCFSVRGTLTILDSSSQGTGKLIGGDVSVNGADNSTNAGTVYLRGNLNLLSGTITGGKSTHGGNIFISTTGELNIYGGTVSDGVVEGDNRYGGNIYCKGNINMYGGAIENGTAQDNGGNISFNAGGSLNLYNGTISGGIVTGGVNSSGTTFTGNGGNIYITGANSRLYMYGGTVCDGQDFSDYGGNIYINIGAYAYMYGGVIENGYSQRGGNNVTVAASTTLDDDTRQYSTLYMMGGTIRGGYGSDTDIYRTTGKLYLYNGRLETVGFDIEKFLAPCACMNTDTTGTTVWHYGDCADCLFAANFQQVETVCTGTHAYSQAAQQQTFVCDICGNTLHQENAAALLNGTLYETLEEALAAAAEGDTLVMTKDLTVGELSLSGMTLDLNGYALTADAFSSVASANVIDTQGGTGKILSQSISVYEKNAYLPVTFEDGLHFCEVGFDQYLERIDNKTTKVKFRFDQRAADTLIDDAIRAGSTDISVQIRLTWKDQKGVKQDKTYVFSHDLLEKYTARWDGRIFVTTIGAVDNVTNLTCTYQVTSKAGATISAVTLKNVAQIKEQLTWDAINSYPIKTADMTTEEMRDLVVSFMYFTKTYLWTPDQTVDYVRNSGGRVDHMNQGTIYGGLPYVGVASGNVYRMMDYIDPDTGLLDMEKALPALSTKDTLAMQDLKYFGSQCSISVYWAWGRVMNSAAYRWTYNTVPNNGFVLLGDMVLPDMDRWTAEYNTTKACQENGEQVTYSNYAAAQKADALVYYIETAGGDGAGHLMMLYEDAHVVYNEDGTINGEESYLTIIDQGQSWKTGTNDAGDSFSHKGNIAQKKFFKDMYDYGYVAFTFKEYLGTDPIEVTEVSLVGGDDSVYTTGIVEETTREFVGTQATDTLTWTELFSSTVVSNYGIADAYIILSDDKGNEIYRHAVRTGVAGNMSLALEETGEMVTTWESRTLFPGRTYNVSIEVQLATGERPVIYNGKLSVEK